MTSPPTSLGAFPSTTDRQLSQGFLRARLARQSLLGRDQAALLQRARPTRLVRPRTDRQVVTLNLDSAGRVRLLLLRECASWGALSWRLNGDSLVLEPGRSGSRDRGGSGGPVVPDSKGRWTIPRDLRVHLDWVDGPPLVALVDPDALRVELRDKDRFWFRLDGLSGPVRQPEPSFPNAGDAGRSTSAPVDTKGAANRAPAFAEPMRVDVVAALKTLGVDLVGLAARSVPPP